MAFPDLSTLPSKECVAVLADFRKYAERQPEFTVELGEKVLDAGYAKKMGDELWPFLEQLGIASLETGNLDLARICYDRLTTRFPDSPRVLVLQGMLLEGEGKIEEAARLYGRTLEVEPTHHGIRKRLISLHLHQSPLSSNPTSSLPPPPGSSTASSSSAVARSTSTSAASSEVWPLSREKGVQMLVEYLDTVYADPEGWTELANVYEEDGLYEQARFCHGELVLLQPQNPYYLLRLAETAYTCGDIGMAYKEFLRVVEMASQDSKGFAGLEGRGIGRRAAIGAKLCAKRFLARPDPAQKTEGDSTTPTNPKEIDLLMTKLLVNVYSKDWEMVGDKVAGPESSKAVKLWVGS